ncbi:Hypothetical predicted protein [Pelobates cultripes]|uniref:Uncharacterized protein n=1 Tax=Pelobates cultripes TaxID=61616 RepID=A0AAD1SL39_PELCU|nr:Hypothetical predicted protein [Pelobates cultripes]
MEERRLKTKMEKKSKKPKAVESTSQKDQGIEIDLSRSKEVSSGSKSNPRDRIDFVSSSKMRAEEGSGSSEKATKLSSATKRPAPATDGKSEAYKSIFSSHSSAKRSNDESCNWIAQSTFYI